MAIYTKRGDGGKTSLYDASSSQRVRVAKNSPVVRAIGAIDQANSYLGVAASFCEKSMGGEIKAIQNDLFRIGSILAGAKMRFTKTKTKKLEKEIDRLEGLLPVLDKFILPGGEKGASMLHYARTLIRRAEREVVALNEKSPVKEEVLAYLNRLSDFLFVKARLVNFTSGKKEEVWTK